MRLITRLREYFHLARGEAVEFELGPYRRVLARIDEHDFEGADDEQLKHKSGELVARARDGVALDLPAGAFTCSPCSTSYDSIRRPPV
jgi:hypothetical protein